LNYLGLYNLYYTNKNHFHLVHLNIFHDYYNYYIVNNFHYHLDNIHFCIDYMLNHPILYDVNIDLVQYNFHEHMLDYKKLWKLIFFKKKLKIKIK